MEIIPIPTSIFWKRLTSVICKLSQTDDPPSFGNTSHNNKNKNAVLKKFICNLQKAKIKFIIYTSNIGNMLMLFGVMTLTLKYECEILSRFDGI